MLTKFPYIITLDGQTINEGSKNQINLNSIDISKYEKIIGVITFDQKYA